MRCIVIDDEPLARIGMEKFIKEVSFLELVGSYGNPFDGINALKISNVDLLFLDIQMPRFTGIDLLKAVNPLPITIITTAYPDYALLSYEFNVMDYLVKPIPFERFIKAINKAKDYFDLLNNKSQKVPDYIFIKHDNRFERIFIRDILFIEGLGNYISIFTGEKKYTTYLTIKGIEENLPASDFVRINKSQILAIAKINSITGNEIKIGTHALVISRKNKNEVLEKIFNNTLLKRM